MHRSVYALSIFLSLNNIPLCVFTTFSLFICNLKDFKQGCDLIVRSAIRKGMRGYSGSREAREGLVQFSRQDDCGLP